MYSLYFTARGCASRGRIKKDPLAMLRTLTPALSQREREAISSASS
jgi:hypothetical protein